MAFDRTQMSALCYNNGFTLWHYRTEDDMYIVTARGYFDEWAEGDILRQGDMIIINARNALDDNAPLHDWVFVQSIDDGVVRVS